MKTTKGMQLAPAGARSSLAKLVGLALLALGLYLVIQDPVGSANAVSSAFSSLTTFGSNINIGGDQR